MTITRLALRQRLARETGLGTLVLCTGGSTTTLIDTSATLTGAYSSERWPRGTAVRYSLLNSTAAVTNSTLDKYAPTTGTVTLATTTTASKAADKAEIWRLVDSVDRVDEAIDAGLTQHCWHWAPLCLTDVPDGDCGEAGVASWGTASNATVTKLPTPPIGWGQGYIFVNNTAGNGYQPSAAIPVQAGDGWVIDVLVYVASGTAALTVYDSTNAAAITLSGDGGSYAGTGWKRLHNTFTIPSGCESIAIRLGGVEATADTYWTSIIAHPRKRREFILPARVPSKEYVADTYYREGEEVEDFARKSFVLFGRTVKVTPAPVGIVVTLDAGTDEPVYVDELRTYPALSSSTPAGTDDAVTTECPPDLAYAAAEYCLYKIMANPEMTKETKSGYLSASDMTRLRDEAGLRLVARQQSLGAGNRFIRR